MSKLSFSRRAAEALLSSCLVFAFASVSVSVAATESTPLAFVTAEGASDEASGPVDSVVKIQPEKNESESPSMMILFGRGMFNTATNLTDALADGVKSTVSGTSNAAGVVGNAVGSAVKSTVSGTVHVAGTVTGIVSDTVKNTVNVAGAVAGGMGSTVSGVARSLIDAPQRMIQYATTMLGTPYKWGGNTIESGLDCSGFVREVVQGATGKLLPRTAKEMSQQGTQVAYTEMKPGDLVFFNTRRRPFSHVGIYLGDGRFMHGASGVKSGKQIRIDSFSSGYYRTRFNGARRIAPPDKLAGATDVIGSNKVPALY